MILCVSILGFNLCRRSSLMDCLCIMYPFSSTWTDPICFCVYASVMCIIGNVARYDQMLFDSDCIDLSFIWSCVIGFCAFDDSGCLIDYDPV